MSPKTAVAKRIWLALLAYVFLLAGRDLGVEHFLSEEKEPSSVAVTFYICSCIFAVSVAELIRKKRLRAFLDKLRHSDALIWSAIASALAAVIYTVTIYMVRRENLGAAVFNFLDFGLAPFCIAGVGIVLDKETPRKELPVSLALYIVGMVAMNWTTLTSPTTVIQRRLLAIALLSPVATGFSDYLSRRFLRKYAFEQVEVLAIRFLMPTIGLGGYLALRGQAMAPVNIGVATALSLLFAFLPLYILYSVLADIDLPYLSIWEMLIPVIIVAETASHDPSTMSSQVIAGCAAILLAYIVYDRRLLSPPPRGS